MDELDAAEILKTFWLEKVDSILSEQIVWATCPFCGKTDRIRILPKPDFVNADESYRSAWSTLIEGDLVPGICGFCLNVSVVKGNIARIPGL
ncbi:MAG: hypothetical protein ACP5U1_10540 [Desulfomonilaceae bacterium]